MCGPVRYTAEVAELVAKSQTVTTRAFQQLKHNPVTIEQHAVVNGLMQQRDHDVFAMLDLPASMETTYYASLSLQHKQMGTPEDSS